MNTQTIMKTRRAQGTGKAVDAIDRLIPRGGRVSVKVEAHHVETWKADEDWEYYVVKTDDFGPVAPKGSILHVFIRLEGSKPDRDELALVSAGNRLELWPAAKCGDVQVIGIVWEIRRWPTMNVNTMHEFKDSEIQAFPPIG